MRQPSAACSAVDRSFSAGLVSRVGAGAGIIRGLVGTAGTSAGTWGSFWDKDTSGQDSSNGGEGKAHSEMQDQSTFENASWLFGTVWTIQSGVDYPDLIDNPRL